MGTNDKIRKTDIEIIRSFDGSNLTTALFDFDGTLSRERDGWVNLMVATCSAAMVQAIPEISVAEAVEWVINDIEQTIGIPTYQQMKRLADEIRKRGGSSLSPQRYKDIYSDALTAMVKTNHQNLEQGKVKIETLRMPGATELLTELEKRFGKDALFLSSGTDIQPVQESVKILGYEKFFEDRIMASGSNGNNSDCPKQRIIEKLIQERNLQPGQLLTFGDGVPEIEYTSKFGGIGVGMLSPDQSHYEHRGFFTIEKKRKRLIEAGACLIVPDFRHASTLVELICSVPMSR
ncbi:HAD family hydrolase [candidate division KSB1 bacterium]|nr:HAD family hydrolase [candidate division KSB1 bacterium]